MFEYNLIFFFILILFFIFFIFFYSFSYFFSFNKNFPPFISNSIYEIIKIRSTQKTLKRVQFIFEWSLKYQNISYGSIFKFKGIPFLITEQNIITDFKLARIILLGEKDKNIEESIKKREFQTMNLVNRSINNIFT